MQSPEIALAQKEQTEWLMLLNEGIKVTHIS